MINQCVVVGRLNNQPELNEETKNCILLIEVQRQYKNEQGIYEKDIVKCTASGAIAENVIKNCKKGSIVGIKGMIITNNIVLAEKITYLNKTKDEE